MLARLSGKSVAVVLICLLALLASMTATAQSCQQRMPELIRSAWPHATQLADGRWQIGGDDPRWLDIGNSQCKVWPAHPELILLAVQLDSADIAQQQLTIDVSDADLEMLVLRGDDANVVARQRSSGLLSSDAISVSSFTLDTARYHLAPGNTAFGLRISRHGASRVNPIDVTSLRLYVLEGDHLRTVLSNLLMDHSGGEWDGNCAGSFFERHWILEVRPERQHRWADLRVTSRDIESVATTGGNGDCHESESTPQRHTTRLRYDGQHYPIPEHLRGLDDDYADPQENG
ncbi:hypothetical protein [Pseudoxanthomonas dokdonensis]|uniref:Uncharacterized protein n=1 Tax=Pseudoxanthomonas dokdonensis TaxID=344882 RepID=A0A0R0CVP2_9GAMM|nr:hypothetical protein [Pseudoxanthomonas dokdonensis]KRG70183.1 hypothetical protein ABB29_06925 [Pseudoxanthomonas dokdonensis]